MMETNTQWCTSQRYARKKTMVQVQNDDLVQRHACRRAADA